MIVGVSLSIKIKLDYILAGGASVEITVAICGHPRDNSRSFWGGRLPPFLFNCTGAETRPAASEPPMFTFGHGGREPKARDVHVLDDAPNHVEKENLIDEYTKYLEGGCLV